MSTDVRQHKNARVQVSCLAHQAASALRERFYSLDLRQDQGMPAPVRGGHGIAVLPWCSPTIRTPKEVPSRGPCGAPGLPTTKGRLAASDATRDLHGLRETPRPHIEA